MPTTWTPTWIPGRISKPSRSRTRLDRDERERGGGGVRPSASAILRAFPTNSTAGGQRQTINMRGCERETVTERRERQGEGDGESETVNRAERTIVPEKYAQLVTGIRSRLGKKSKNDFAQTFLLVNHFN